LVDTFAGEVCSLLNGLWPLNTGPGAPLPKVSVSAFSVFSGDARGVFAVSTPDFAADAVLSLHFPLSENPFLITTLSSNVDGM
jgi:hypothetical protein